MHEPATPGRPRSDIDSILFTATLRTIHSHGYAGATMDRIASTAGVAKTTIYRRWPSKGALIVDCLVDAFGPVPIIAGSTVERVGAAVRWIAGKIAEPGAGAGFAGVYSDAITDPSLRVHLVERLQEPYRVVLQDAFEASPRHVLLLVDLVVGTLLHRLGLSGEPMAEDDLDDLIAMVAAVLQPSADR